MAGGNDVYMASAGSARDLQFATPPAPVGASQTQQSSAAAAAAAANQAGHQRTYQACIPCRRRKVRCDLGSVDNPHDPPCLRCRREAKECFFSATRRKKKDGSRESISEEPGQGQDDGYELKTGRKRQRRDTLEAEEEEDDDSPSVRSKDRKANVAAKSQEQAAQVIPGVPNELLLPGAIAVLAGVIVVTFAVGRASSR